MLTLAGVRVIGGMYAKVLRKIQGGIQYVIDLANNRIILGSTYQEFTVPMFFTYCSILLVSCLDYVIINVCYKVISFMAVL